MHYLGRALDSVIGLQDQIRETRNKTESDLGRSRVDSKFSTTKAHVSLRGTFSKYQVVIRTIEECEKNWYNQLRKGHAWFIDRACNQQGNCKYQSKIQWHISLEQDATTLQAEVAAILDYVTRRLGKRLVKEQITICTDSQVAVAALGTSRTKSPLVVECIEN